jgi:hypothetical protein
MNNQRRKRIESLKEQFESLILELEEIEQEEEEYLENIPENLQGSERYSNSENALAEIQEAKQYFEDACTCLENSIQN